MTPEEMAAELYEKNRQAMKDINVTPSDSLMKILTEASVRGMKLGSDLALASVQAELVRMVMMDKSKER